MRSTCPHRRPSPDRAERHERVTGAPAPGTATLVPPTRGELTMSEELIQELQSLRDEVARLREQVEPRGDHGVSRRHLLRAAPVFALGGALAAVASASPAAAAVGDPVLQGKPNHFGL